jgi:acyl carrier protein
MTKDEVFKKIQEILVQEFELSPDAVSPEAKLFQDLELDSIDAVDLLVRMKEYVPGKIEPDLFKKAVTVGDVVEILYPLCGQDDGL